MKLFTHNLLVCNKKGVKDGYPLKIEAKKVSERGAVARSVRASSPSAIFKACVGSIPRFGSVL